MVVVEDEAGHIEGCDVIGDDLLTSCAAREAEVDIIDIKPAADKALIGVAGTGCAATLGYGRAIVNGGCCDGVVGCGGEGCGTKKAYVEVGNVIVERKIDGEEPFPLVTDVDNGLKTALCTYLRNERLDISHICA